MKLLDSSRGLSDFGDEMRYIGLLYREVLVLLPTEAPSISISGVSDRNMKLKVQYELQSCCRLSRMAVMHAVMDKVVECGVR